MKNLNRYMMRLESLETGFVSYYVSHREFKCAYEIRQQSASQTMQAAQYDDYGRKGLKVIKSER